MQDYPLTLPMILRRAETLFADSEIVTASPGGLERTTTARGPSAPTALAACSTSWASAPTAGSATFGWNTARHLECYYAGSVHRPGPAHAEHPPVRRPAHLHRQPRRGRGDLRRSEPAPAALAARADVRDRQALRRHGRRRRLRDPRRRRRHRVHDYETLLAAASPVEFDVDDENSGRGDVLHVAAPPATRRASCTATARWSCTRSASMATDLMGVCETDTVLADRADVPRQRVGPGAQRARWPARTSSSPART